MPGSPRGPPLARCPPPPQGRSHAPLDGPAEARRMHVPREGGRGRPCSFRRACRGTAHACARGGGGGGHAPSDRPVEVWCMHGARRGWGSHAFSAGLQKRGACICHKGGGRARLLQPDLQKRSACICHEGAGPKRGGGAGYAAEAFHPSNVQAPMVPLRTNRDRLKACGACGFGSALLDIYPPRC